MRLCALFIATFLVVVPIEGQNTDIEGLAFGLQFNFGNPGARALGMGGAFIGAADDASAVEANPAGLTALTRPEFSIEGRRIDQASPFPIAGTFEAIEFGTARSGTRFADPSFASVVFPVGDFRFAAYFHNPLEYVETRNAVSLFDEFGLSPRPAGLTFFFRRDGGLLANEEECERIRMETSDFFACSEFSSLPYIASNQLSLKTTGVVGAWKRGSFSMGLGLRRHTFNERAVTFRFDQAFLVSSVSSQVSDDTTWTGTAGVKWAPSTRFSIGGVYKRGPEFETDLESEIDGVVVLTATPSFHTPDVAGIGLSYRPFESALLNVDVIHVSYSNLVDDFVSISPDRIVYEIKDGTEVHVGVEYFLPESIARQYPLVVRGGVWRDPAHRLTFADAEQVDTIQSAVARLLFPKFDDETHKCIGLGLAYPRFQLDAAYDSSKTTTTASLTIVVRF